jgi:Xaa-Pro dipeptidase
MTVRNDLPFTVAEYGRRLDGVRRNMDQRGVDVMLTTVPENIVYLTGYHSLGYFTHQILIVPRHREPILLTRAINVDKARVDSCLQHIEGYRDTEDPNQATYDVLGKYGLIGQRIGSQDDAWFFSVARYKALRRRLAVEDLVDCSGVVEQVRRVKSPREIEYIREAGRYCAASLDAAIASVKPGVLETEVSAAGHHAMYRSGSEYPGHSPQFVAGAPAGLGFECAMRRAIQPNDVVYMEAGATHNRYNCMLSRTVIVGKPDPRWVAMCEASRDGLNAAKAKIRAGVTSAEVDFACREVIRRAGFAQYFTHRTGYSIGIGFPPDWGEGRIMSINEGDPTVLEAGMCFHLIPDLKATGEGGVVFSEAVVVTETGWDPLSAYPQEIFYK